MTIAIENEYDGFEAFRENLSEEPSDIVEKAILSALDHEENPYECEVNVLFCADDRIREINLENRKLDKSTDVLSFPMIDYEAPADFTDFDDMPYLFNPETGELMLGDIVISIDHVICQAAEYGHSLDRELAFLCVHSMLHLMGYDHMEDGERLVMEEHQRQILTEAGYER